MWALLFPVGLLGLMYAMGAGKKKESNGGSKVGTGPIYTPQAGQIWTLGVKSSRPLGQVDWEQYFQAFPGEIYGVTGDPAQYVVTARFTQDIRLPPIGTVIKTPEGDTIKLLFAQQAPAM